MSFRKIILQYDIARGRVPRPETISRQLEILVPLGLTGIMLYMESVLGTGAFPSCGSGAVKVDAPYIRAIREICEDCKIDLIAHLQILGHQRNLLGMPEMKNFADEDGGDCFRIDSPELRKKMKAHLTEIAALFPSRYIHCGGDEAIRLGLGKSSQWLGKVGYEQGVADYINEMNAHLRSIGKIMLIYADESIIFPGLTAMLDPDIVMVNWAYCFEDEIYEQENHHYENHAQAVAGHHFMVTANNMAEYVFTPFRRLEANIGIWKKLGRGAEAFIISDWGSFENINPYSLSLIGTFYSLKKLRDDAYGIDEFVRDVRQLAGYDESAEPFLKDMFLAQSGKYFPGQFGYPLLPMFLTGNPDSREIIYHAAFLEKEKIDVLLNKMVRAESALKSVPIHTSLACDLVALANRLVASVLRMKLCCQHAAYMGACWVPQSQIEAQNTLYEECKKRMTDDLHYLIENWHEESFPACFSRTKRYYECAISSLKQTLDLKENSMSRYLGTSSRH